VSAALVGSGWVTRVALAIQARRPLGGEPRVWLLAAEHRFSNHEEAPPLSVNVWGDSFSRWITEPEGENWSAGMLDSSKLESDSEVARRVPQGAVGDRRATAGRWMNR